MSCHKKWNYKESEVCYPEEKTCGVDIPKDVTATDVFIKNGYEVPDLRKMAKDADIESVPSFFMCDSLNCRHQQDDILGLCGLQTSEDRIDDFIKDKINQILDLQIELVSLKEECKKEQLLVEDLLTAMGYDEIKWNSEENCIRAIKDNRFFQWKNKNTYQMSHN